MTMYISYDIILDEYDRYMRSKSTESVPSSLSHYPSHRNRSHSNVSQLSLGRSSLIPSSILPRAPSAMTRQVVPSLPGPSRREVTPSILAAPRALLNAYGKSIVRWPLYSLGVLTTDIEDGRVQSVRWTSPSQVRLRIEGGPPYASGAMRHARLCRIQETVGVPFLDQQKTYIIKTHKDDLVDLFENNYTSRDVAIESLVDKVFRIAKTVANS
jgi:hypothetical protein